MIATTPHPEWLQETLNFLEPLERRVTDHQLFKDFREGRLSISHIQKTLINFYPLIETFPKYLALNLTKVPPASEGSNIARHWLIKNINQERLHSDWWKNLAAGFGVPTPRLDHEIAPPAGMDAINNYLWRVCTHGSLAEAMAACNYSIEGPTGVWTKSIQSAFQIYEKEPNLKINKKTLEWITAHARYDDRHPVEALEIIKLFTKSKVDQRKVQRAAERALQYYELALDGALTLGMKTRVARAA